MALDRGYVLNNRYRIVDILGQGGMAALYRAVDMNLGVEVAVKENLFTTEEYARQFRLEAEILASLRHPNLPRVTDHFVIEGQGQYLVMDYIEGEDLRQRIDRSGVLTDEEAIVVGVAICDALIYLHSRKPIVLHRDIKPGNVKITSTGQVYLVDFGLAKVVQGRSHTETGARAMTPGYSPPEQYGTAHTDHRSDIYSLGATLYSSLTDVLPEDGLARAMDQARLTPVRKHNPRVPRRLEQVLDIALAVHPEDRYQSADEFRTALLNTRERSRRQDPLELVITPPPEGYEEFQAASPEQPELIGAADGPVLPVSRPVSDRARPSTKSRRARRRKAGFLASWFGIMLFLVLLAGGVGIYFFRPDITAAWLGNIQRTTPESTKLPTNTKASIFLPPATASYTPTATLPVVDPSPTANVTQSPYPTRTPLGGGVSRLAFASDRTGIPQIYLANLDGSGLMQLTEIEVGACQPTWSPDGKRIAFVSPCRKEQDTYPSSGILIIDLDDLQIAQISEIPTGDYEPAWSPDGSLIAFTSLREGRQPKIYVYNVITDLITPLAVEGTINMQAAWSDDGSMIAFISNRNSYFQIWTMYKDGSNQQLYSRRNTYRLSYPTWSPDTKVIAYTQASSDTGVPNLYTTMYGETWSTGVRLYKDSADPMRAPAFTPDGRWILFETWQVAEDHNIAMISTSGIVYRDVITSPSNDFDPAVRP